MNENVFRSQPDVPEFTGADGARIREVAGRSTGLSSHSLAVITHPAGVSTVEHHHSVADEVYYVKSGTGRIRVDDETWSVQPGDTIIIRPGQRHKVWADGPADLVLIVSCAPAYSVPEVIWDED